MQIQINHAEERMIDKDHVRPRMQPIPRSHKRTLPLVAAGEQSGFFRRDARGHRVRRRVGVRFLRHCWRACNIATRWRQPRTRHGSMAFVLLSHMGKLA